MKALFTADSLKDELRRKIADGKPWYGGVGERIYAMAMSAEHTVESLHRGGVDFLIDGQRRVDVKTTLRLDQVSSVKGRPLPSCPKAPSIEYPMVVFYADEIVVYEAGSGRNRARIARVSWSKTAEIVNKEPRFVRVTEDGVVNDRRAQGAACAALRAWIADQWHLRAKVVYRANPVAQRKFGSWGPESFYHNPKSKIDPRDLIVLLYFDGPDVQDVLAYPIAQSSAISWSRKTVGLNHSKRMKFDPAELAPQFRFGSLSQFKRDFRKRFPGD